MNGITQLLSAYTYIIFLKGNLASVENPNCSKINENNKFIDCRRIYAFDSRGGYVPNDLDKRVQIMDLSFNKFKTLVNEVFEGYTNLIRLVIHGSTVGSYEAYVFKPLINLEELDISLTKFLHPPTFFWPLNIRKLNVSRTEKTDLNCADLTLLDVVDASHNDIEQFPHLNLRAPLTNVILDGNKLKALRVELVSQYCNLKRLSMKVPKESDLLSPPKYCDCLRLNVWFQEYQIPADTLECQEKAGDVCNKHFGEDVLAKRRDCLGLEAHNFKLYMILSVSLLGFLTFIALLFAVRYVRLRKHIRPAESDDAVTEAEDENDLEEETP